MNRSANLIDAPSDGKSLYLGYQSTEVCVHKTGEIVYFHYVTEPPHGDALLQLMVRCSVFPGYIWGSSTYWSPNGRYLVAEWTGFDIFRPSRRTVLIDLILWKYIDCESFLVQCIDDSGVHGKDVGGNRATILFLRQTDWQAA
jgi:hypothetical protein